MLIDFVRATITLDDLHSNFFAPQYCALSLVKYQRESQRSLHLPAPLPVLCTTPAETSLPAVRGFENGLRMQDVMCGFFVF